MKSELLIAVWTILIAWGTIAFIQERTLDTHVWWSVSRDECVRVDPPDRGTCEDLPERYRKVPVQ